MPVDVLGRSRRRHALPSVPRPEHACALGRRSSAGSVSTPAPGVHRARSTDQYGCTTQRRRGENTHQHDRSLHFTKTSGPRIVEEHRGEAWQSQRRPRQRRRRAFPQRPGDARRRHRPPGSVTTATNDERPPEVRPVARPRLDPRGLTRVIAGWTRRRGRDLSGARPALRVALRLLKARRVDASDAHLSHCRRGPARPRRLASPGAATAPRRPGDRQRVRARPESSRPRRLRAVLPGRWFSRSRAGLGLRGPQGPDVKVPVALPAARAPGARGRSRVRGRTRSRATRTTWSAGPRSRASYGCRPFRTVRVAGGVGGPLTGPAPSGQHADDELDVAECSTVSQVDCRWRRASGRKRQFVARRDGAVNSAGAPLAALVERRAATISAMHWGVPRAEVLVLDLDRDDGGLDRGFCSRERLSGGRRSRRARARGRREVRAREEAHLALPLPPHPSRMGDDHLRPRLLRPEREARAARRPGSSPAERAHGHGRRAGEARRPSTTDAEPLLRRA